jgi:protein ImuA
MALVESFEADPRHGVRSLGIETIDAVLGGGLTLGALHEIAPVAPLHLGAATGFALALASRDCSRKSVLWIQPEFAGQEAGNAYGPGLALFGLPLERLLILRVTCSRDALWAMEEALKCRALSTVIAELTDDAADLTATRRLVLAARDGGSLGLLMRHRSTREPNASVTRWEVSAAAGRSDGFGGLGRPSFDLSLVKNRRGICSRWSVAWSGHEHAFTPLSRGVAAVAAGRPADAPRARTG